MTAHPPGPIPPIKNRPIGSRDTDRSALNALVQAAINVELFTIPLYLGTLYSIQGMHEINAAGQTFYRGRRWPGAAPRHTPVDANERAFNVVFSVFIQEMLHLQLAANIASVVGVTPSFTSQALQDPRHGWVCFGPDQHVIPHIVDLRDTRSYAHVVVDVRPLDAEQRALLLAIEEPEDQARARIEPSKLHRYFPAVPFAGWTPDKTERDLPLFGTIGYMYECIVAYMTIEYDDGTSLWDNVFDAQAVQRELFNTPSGSHPMAEYPGFPTLVPTSNPVEALSGAIDMIRAITDQGEGNGDGGRIRAMLGAHRAAVLQAMNNVEPVYRSSDKALKLDYPSYDANGMPVPSATAAARFQPDGVDHYARFKSLEDELHGLVTWKAWHDQHGPQPWQARYLLTGERPDDLSPELPSAEDIAAALNRLKAKDVDGSVHRQLSQVAVGSIYGITRVLDSYWQGTTDTFPFPAMGGSGDRIATCWAVLGKAPDLRIGLDPPPAAPYYHACQGLDLNDPGSNTMPLTQTFHTCIGSNECKGQGGCGFVQKLSGGGSCSGGGGGGGGGGCNASAGNSISAHLAANLCGQALFSAPADNACGQLGGCAVPISASQLYPRNGTMQLYDIAADGSPKVGELAFEYGQPVYATAWKAYVAVLASRGIPAPKQPAPDDLRLAFPPST